ncbi:hypothetical protein [Vibrio sp. 10N.239.312.D08]|uniref:hypothetical protein n=1 Tax=Vibrio sp. 10N.239.312.D08 TaxID=3229978 RepID=UPI00354EF872
MRGMMSPYPTPSTFVIETMSIRAISLFLLLPVEVMASTNVHRMSVPQEKEEVKPYELPLIELGYVKPPKPNAGIDARTVAGIDVNYNGVRDSAEIIFYEMLLPSKQLVVGDYEAFLDVASMFTPYEPAVERSIYFDEINCAYNKLPYYVKSRVSLRSLYDVMINNSKRKFAFEESVVLPSDHDLNFRCR